MGNISIKPNIETEFREKIEASKSTVCTVFEGSYHIGVSALVNSLYVNGYRGIVWAGYKGALPNWAKIDENTEGVEKMGVCENLVIHFVRFSDKAFLPYSKPNFMLDIFDKFMPTVENVFYIDCDIVVKCRFSYLEEWASFGIALCEDVGSPLPSTHPVRGQWMRYFEKYNMYVKNKDNLYVNGGFVGVNRLNKGFLKIWQRVQDVMMEDIKEINGIGLKDPTYLFHRTDQDALNITKDLYEADYSISDKSGMDFQGYGYIMSHAAGKGKPWTNNWLKQVFINGIRPSTTDRVFMQYTQHPLSIYSPFKQFFRKIHLQLAIILGRILA